MLRLRIVATALAVLFGLTAARADSLSDFYKGREVTLIVGFGAGSGYDVYARLFARFLSRYISGQPKIDVQNMPGAASLRAVNFLYNDAPDDGTVIGTFSRDIPLIGIAGNNPQARFDPAGFTWLGSSSSFANDARLLFVRKGAPVGSIEEARRPGWPPLVLGATAEGAATFDATNVARDALGLNVEIIANYPNQYAPYYAVMRREVDGRFASLSLTAQTQPNWLRPDGDMRVLMQFGHATRLSKFPNVPTARELARTAKARALVELAELPYRLSRSFVAPPGVPSDRAKA